MCCSERRFLGETSGSHLKQTSQSVTEEVAWLLLEGSEGASCSPTRDRASSWPEVTCGVPGQAPPSFPHSGHCLGVPSPTGPLYWELGLLELTGLPRGPNVGLGPQVLKSGVGR